MLIRVYKSLKKERQHSKFSDFFGVRKVIEKSTLELRNLHTPKRLLTLKICKMCLEYFKRKYFEVGFHLLSSYSYFL